MAKSLFVIYSFLMALGLSNCAGIGPASSNASDTVQSGQGEEQMLFLSFKIKKTSNNSPEVLLLSKQQVAGKAKKPPMYSHAAETQAAEDLLIIYQYKGNSAVDSITLSHPLYPHIESFAEDHMHQHSVVLDSAEFFVRLQVQQGVRQVRIKESLKGKSEYKFLNIINL